MSINRVILLGNVGSDPEIRNTQGGDKVATFRIATSETWKDKQTGERKEATEWHAIVVFNQNIVGVVEQFVSKGSKVGVEGAIKTRKWQDQAGADRYSTEIVIGRFDGRLSLEGSPQGAKRDEHGYGESRTRDTGQGYGATKSGGPIPPSGNNPLDDDIPF
jgi:single-strand DNA-binding protein